MIEPHEVSLRPLMFGLAARENPSISDLAPIASKASLELAHPDPRQSGGQPAHAGVDGKLIVRGKGWMRLPTHQPAI
jgi:hypothetical protein